MPIIDPLLADAIEKVGLVPPNSVKTDEYVRFPRQGKNRFDRAGWCYVAPGQAYATYGNWATQESYYWSRPRGAYAHSETPSYLDRFIASIDSQKQKEVAYQEAATRALEVWNECSELIGMHPYVERKMIYPYGARIKGPCLVLPIQNSDMEIESLQSIDKLGRKKFMPGGRIKGNYIHVYGEHSFPKKLVVTEGWATACTLVDRFPEATIVAALSCSNIADVTMELKYYWPGMEKVIIAADDDRKADVNIGYVKAKEAAMLTGAELISPNWPDGAPDTLTDFNDLHCWKQGGCHD